MSLLMLVASSSNEPYYKVVENTLRQNADLTYYHPLSNQTYILNQPVEGVRDGIVMVFDSSNPNAQNIIIGFLYSQYREFFEVLHMSPPCP